MTHTQARSSQPYARILTVAAVALAVVALGLTVASIQVAVARTTAKALEKRLATVASALAVEHAKLTTEFATAGEMRTELQEVRREIDAVRAEAVSMGAPKLLPTAGVGPLADALVTHSDALAAYCDILSDSAVYVVKRAQTFTEIATALDQLAALSEKGVTVGDGEKIVKDARADFEAAFARMQSQSPTSPVLYSNVHVMPHLEDLSTSLADIEKAITARNATKIAGALKTYMAAVGTDWVSSMTLEDPAGRQAANDAASTAKRFAALPEKRSASLGSLGQTLLLLALGAAVLAGLSALGAWRLRSTLR